jgi:hypothetical protein
MSMVPKKLVAGVQQHSRCMFISSLASNSETPAVVAMLRKIRVGPQQRGATNLRCSTADRDDVEPVLGMSEQPGSLDDAHFLGLAVCGALQHGEDGRCCVAQCIRCV